MRFVRKVMSIKRAQLVAAILLLAVMLTGCARSGTATPRPSTPEAAPTQRPEATGASRSEVTVLADGHLVAVNPVVPLGFVTSGQLLTVTVGVGDVVAAGDLIAELDMSDLEERLVQARLNQQSAENALAKAEQDLADALLEAQLSLEKLQVRLEQAQAQNVDTPITIAYIRFQQAERSLADAQQAYSQAWDSARDWELYMTDPTGIPPFQGPSMKDQLEAERLSTQRALAMARDNLEIARADYTQALASRESHGYDLQALQLDIELAEFQVEQLRRGVDPSLELNIEQARFEVQVLERQMSDGQLLAPQAGLVLTQDAMPGALVGAGAPIITLFDAVDLEFHTTNLSERDLGQVKPGQPARMVLKTYPDDPLTGTVVRIAPQAGPLVGDAATFVVIIQLAPTALELRPGMTGRVEIETGG
jgi:multidrug efflux pump subunit AcrA (membrane-fusion protein)